jgi:TolB-like protein/Flp pilus assembly protein TadD
VRDPFCDFAEVDALLERALDLPENPSELRERLLAAATAGREELREKVEALLRTAAGAESPLETGAALAGRRAALLAESMSLEEVLALSAGTRLGRYEVLAPIAAGGMGEVYRARDTRLLREVALKVLPEDVAQDPERLARFEREARALAALNHPNIATLHGIDEEGGLSFLVLELLAGESLRQRLERRALAIDEALDFAAQMAAALEAAHGAGIVHRDLKPANVQVLPDGRVKLLDFGIAKFAPAVAEGGRSEPLETFVSGAAPGGVLGTAPYMSPEQWRGRTVDRRADVWSFGCVLYEMLAGRRAFDGETETDVAVAVLGREPDWSALPAGASAVVRGLLTACLTKEPHDRPEGLASVREVLEGEIGRLAVERAPEPGPREASARRWVVALGQSARPRGWLAAAAGIAILGALGGGFALRRTLDHTSARPVGPGRGAATVQEQRAPRIAVLQFENLGEPDDAYFADGMTEEIRSRLGGVAGLAILSRTSVQKYRDSRLAAREIGSELGVDYLLEGTVRWQHSPAGRSEVRVSPRLVRVAEDAQVWTEQYDAPLADVFGVQADIARKVSARLGIAVRESEERALAARPTANLAAYDAFLRGEDYLHRGSELQSRDEVDIAIGMYQEAVRLDPAFSLSWSRLARAHAWLYQWYFDRSEARLRAARDAVDRAQTLDPGLPDAHFALGQILLDEGRPELAMEEFRTVLRTEPNHAESLNGLSHAAISRGDWDEGRRYAARALELTPSSAALACWTGGSHTYASRFQESIEFHESAVKLAPDRACHYFCAVEAYLNWDGDTRRARQFLERVPRQLDRERSPALGYLWVQVEMIDGRWEEALRHLSEGGSPVLESPWFLVPKSLLAAQVHDLRGEAVLARERYAEAVSTLEALLADRPLDARLHGGLGLAYAGVGRRDDAVRAAERGIELLGEDRTDVAYRLRDLAVTHARLGDRAEALATLERLLALKSGFFSPALLRVEPLLRDVAVEPGFTALLAADA